MADVVWVVRHGQRQDSVDSEWFDAEPETLAHEALGERFDTVRLDHDPYVVPSFPETHGEAIARVGETARRIVADTAGEVLLVGHGITVAGAVTGLVGSADGVDAPLCGLTRLERDGGDWRLDSSGDTTHLDQ